MLDLKPDTKVSSHQAKQTPTLAPTWRRRAVVAGAVFLAIAWVITAPRLPSLRSKTINYQEIDGLAPFRELQGAGSVSTSGALFVGLVTPAAVDPRIEALVRDDPCAALFGNDHDGTIPVAIFSDFNCPNCRILDAILTEYDQKHPRAIRIIRHELPILGSASSTASRAVLAADLQGGYQKMHDRLIQTRMVTDLDYVAQIADAEGLDGVKLVSDMQSPEISTALEISKAIAAVFGFYGTPGTVIGRTAFVGAISAKDVATIIRDEQGLPVPVCN